MTTQVAPPAKSFTLEAFLIPLLKQPKIAQTIKWTVYGLLVINLIAFIVDDYQVFISTLDDSAALSELIESWSTTIDMIAWLGLVFLFELETYALPDAAFKPWLTRTLQIARMVCYLSLALAAYSYTTDAIDNYDVAPWPDVTSLCQLADQGVALQLDNIDYADITSANCAELSAETSFYKFEALTSIIDGPTLKHIQWIDWFGVLNAFVWIIVVLLIEVELRLQNAGHFADRAIKLVRKANTFFYAILIMNGLIWLFTGYPLWAWDAFLWIAGFWAIELNMVEWEKGHMQEQQSGDSKAPMTG